MFCGFAAFVLVIVFIGLRHRVGMDWNNYLRMSRAVEGRALFESMICEPGYAVLLWFSTWTGNSVYLVNVIGTVIFAAGVFRFARRCPEPWLALLAAVPVLFVVVGMSASRQAIAIGIVMWCFAGWEQSTTLRKIAS